MYINTVQIDLVPTIIVYVELAPLQSVQVDLDLLG